MSYTTNKHMPRIRREAAQLPSVSWLPSCYIVLIVIGLVAPFLPSTEELHYKEEFKKA